MSQVLWEHLPVVLGTDCKGKGRKRQSIREATAGVEARNT